MAFIEIETPFQVDVRNLGIPTDEFDATMLIRKGFMYEFLKTVIFKPIIKFKGKDVLMNWYQNKDKVLPPDEKEVFKSGTQFVNYIHLQVI